MGHVKHGREWLAEFFDGTTPSTDLPWLSPEQAPVGQDDADPYMDLAFAHAFDPVPSKYSDRALALFLTYKGFYQGLGRNTVEGIRAGFKDMWEQA